MNEQMTDMNLEEVTNEEVADTPAVEETTSDTTAEAVAEEGAPFDRQMAHFVDCCENGTATIAPAEDALALMEFYDAAYRSAAEGREILL